MSYILDALRRADTERASGGIPSLNSRPEALSAADAPAAPTAQGSPLVWLIVGVAIALLGWLGLHLLSGDSTVPASAPVAMAPQPAPIAAPAPVTPTRPEPSPAAAPIDVAPAAAAPSPPPTARTSTADQAVSRKPASPGAQATGSAPGSAPPKMNPADPKAPQDAGAEARVYTPGELPEDVRRELPALSIGGAMYSQTPANRMLIINGQVFHEGDKPLPGLLLEQIRLKGAVLKFRGYRYAIGY